MVGEGGGGGGGRGGGAEKTQLILKGNVPIPGL